MGQLIISHKFGRSTAPGLIKLCALTSSSAYCSFHLRLCHPLWFGFCPQTVLPGCMNGCSRLKHHILVQQYPKVGRKDVLYLGKDGSHRSGLAKFSSHLNIQNVPMSLPRRESPRMSVRIFHHRS